MEPVEPRTVREARLSIREAERTIDAIRMSPAAALGGIGAWYLRQAQARLRAAEREFAKHDDPREEPLKPLAPNVQRSPSTRERRRRYRCSACFEEDLIEPSRVQEHPHHERYRRDGDGRYCTWACGAWEPVARRTRRLP